MQTCSFFLYLSMRVGHTLFLIITLFGPPCVSIVKVRQNFNHFQDITKYDNSETTPIDHLTLIINTIISSHIRHLNSFGNYDSGPINLNT